MTQICKNKYLNKTARELLRCQIKNHRLKSLRNFRRRMKNSTQTKNLKRAHGRKLAQIEFHPLRKSPRITVMALTRKV